MGKTKTNSMAGLKTGGQITSKIKSQTFEQNRFTFPCKSKAAPKRRQNTNGPAKS